MLPVLFLVGIPESMAESRVCAADVIDVKTRIGQVTEIVVENGVADLVRSGDPATLKVEHSAGHLFITPLSTEPAVLTVIDKRGHSSRIRHVFGEKIDEKIFVADCSKGSSVPEKEDTVVYLMRELVRGRVPKTATAKVAARVMFEDDQWQIRCVRIFEMPLLWGYCAVIKNKTSGPAVIPIQRFSFPGLLAIATEKDVLAPENESQMYMVVKR
ncbi:MAG: type-F conjugative transfer system secretin TraK [Candidatus Omnitrophota bacterium]